MSSFRDPQAFNPENLTVLGLDFTPYSRSIMMEVLRGLGCRNSNLEFSDSTSFLSNYEAGFASDVLLFSHEADYPLDFEILEQLRRSDHKLASEVRVILISSIATKAVIVTARDAGVDEIVIRPLSPSQLCVKLKQSIEAPRNFVTSGKYVGPCRRRKLMDYYSGPRRRLVDFENENGSRDIEVEGNADELATAVTELREACGKLTEERVSLITRVRQMANKTAQIAREKNDVALATTADAVQLYLNGVGTQNQMETHVLETGINALTQLSILPDSYRSARDSVAKLMTVAVRKKLLVYETRAKTVNSESDGLLDQINSGSEFDLDDPIAV